MTQEAVIAVLRLGIPVYCWAVKFGNLPATRRKLVIDANGTVSAYDEDDSLVRIWNSPNHALNCMYIRSGEPEQPLYRSFTTNPEDLK